MTSNPMRTYVFRTAAFMTAYVAINIAAITGAFDDAQRPGAYILALAVTAPVVGQLWAMLDLMKNADEYISRIVARPFIVAAVLAIAVVTGWGFAAEFAGAPPAPGWLIYPLLWLMYGLAAPLMKPRG